MKTKIKVSVIIISSFLLFLFGALFINTAEKISNYNADIYRSANEKKAYRLVSLFYVFPQG